MHGHKLRFFIENVVFVQSDTSGGGVPAQRGPPYDAVLETVLPIIKDLLIDSSEDVSYGD